MIYRKIDKNGYYLEDVIWEPKLDKNGTPLESKPKDLIREEFSHDKPLYKPKWDGTEWVEGNTDAATQASVERRIGSIEQYIYEHYSMKKQSQDRSYQSYAQAAIVAMTAQTDNPVTLDGLTIEIAGVVLKINAGDMTLQDYISSKPEELQEHYEKLSKIGLRLKWTKICIDEWKSAIATGRDPQYPEYPTFK